MSTVRWLHRYVGWDERNYDEEKINMLLNNKGIIRNKLKIIAAINNAKIFK